MKTATRNVEEDTFISALLEKATKKDKETPVKKKPAACDSDDGECLMCGG